MSINEIIKKAIENPENWYQEGQFRGGLNWNAVDSELWLHDDIDNFTDVELIDGLDNYPDPTPEITQRWRDSVNSKATQRSYLISLDNMQNKKGVSYTNIAYPSVKVIC
jgi:hypothetical protein